MTTFLNNLNKLNEIEKNRLESFRETLSEVTQSHEELNARFPNRQEAEQTFELYELSLTNLYLTVSHANDMNEVNALAYRIRIDTLNLSLIGIVESFELLISQNDPALSKEKIKSTVKLALGLVGLVPTIFTLPFSLASLTWDIYDKTKIEETRVGTATDIINSIRQFF